MTHFKRPVSVLVVIHTATRDVLLLERAAHPGYWQSVTGSQEGNESLLETAYRELFEETGLSAQSGKMRDWQQTNTYEIFPEWRHRYAPGITQNTEHVFSFELAEIQPIQLAPKEHRNFQWLPSQLAAELCFSASNQEAIRALSP